MNARVEIASQTAVDEPLITCIELGHVYDSGRGRTAALGSISLTIDRGEFVCVLGPSGCGKTTLLNILAGFVVPAHGDVRVGGHAIDGPSSERGVVFQDYSLFPWLTSQANVEFGLRMAGRAARERAKIAHDLLGLVGLPDVGTKYPFELSGGMKQRIAIARALATRPSLLLMDEPFAALDAMTRSSLQAKLIEIHQQEQPTILFVTHNIAEALVLASRLIVMSPNPGRIVEDISVDLPRPRRRTSPRFNELYEHVARAIGLETAE
ncbi:MULTISPECIES: ABC transporter ATP-binding protein [Bradyrhizobium]|jgi:ABC-type nitrate/sulfonate/bicarbonate transport system ATPase subunit|uniref:ABC transporter ATP-binding protein n=1 Tax=Bradyrhizobium TaxID=374 RepID=UPI0009B8A0F4|nr:MULTISPECIES: ABC transporter ATP-binding protein [Bradyrhizobium]MCS3451226.1 NitT/TauT family transport system ATP-binding protein [Bradyrhizobium elkanii]MCS3566751.1 NitT/TauT family transport system ATP-binding protein [Bradyrhizobium elkanii]MCW2152524.1 NitT/TauT family transport system ATP-binding protein [Bradyrhizobium elkanii]MCW2357598.1 NitT/TauT family transport system ATP-binding protein [Bradyrhizobium elkanii]MCW2376255.1 NitT/TauT family transport system ATP-binding protei